MAPSLVRPGSVPEAAELLRELGAAGGPLRVRGGATKLDWVPAPAPPAVDLHTGGLSRVLEHNEGDFTAVLEAGVPLAQAQERFAATGQMLALDPPLAGADGTGSATIGGVLATADSGPLRHRYGGVRDLVLGVTLVLSDGTVAKAGGRVIKNVAGYDLGKLFTGSFGTLGLVATVSLRLHPRPETSASACGTSADPAILAGAARGLAGLPLEADCLDVAWESERGAVLARFSGATALERARATAGRMAELGLAGSEVIEADDELWETQRRRQRCAEGAVVKVAGVITGLTAVLEAARELDAGVVARAALGLAWVRFEGSSELAERVGALRAALPEASLTVLDGAGALAPPGPALDPGVQALMARLKARFDPAGVFAPGVIVGAR